MLSTKGRHLIIEIIKIKMILYQFIYTLFATIDDSFFIFFVHIMYFSK